MTPPSAAIPPLATKTHRDESFPVASRLVSPAHRSVVLAFYRFVRAADDVADSPDLTPPEKLARLDALEDALLSADPAEPVARGLAQADRRQGCGAGQARAMLEAFRQDAVKGRYADMAELENYCARSANPVGRFLLALHGEGAEPEAPADALCTALQVLNHLQDLVPDRNRLDRIYVPEPWMALAGGEAAFFAPENGAARRRVLDALLDRVDAWLDIAEALPARVRSRRLAAESAATIATGRMLARRLRARDPVLERVALGKGDFARAFAGALPALVRRGFLSDAAVCRRIVARSGSSFRLGMASLRGERRRAIHAVYAFCRAIDDAADAFAPPGERRAAIDAWRQEIDRLVPGPRTPIGRELAVAVDMFGLDPAELHLLLDGMAADAAPRVRLADEAALDLYCRQVAGAVGALSVRIFGAPEAHAFALALGRTLQLVNILRDLDEDGANERVYVPLSRLAAAGIPDGPAPAVVADPRFAAVCEALAREAEAGFAAADRMLGRLDRRALKPAILMMAGYRVVLARLQARGFARRGPRVRPTGRDRLRLVGLALRSAP
ncbi:MAG TPA: squalene/phytoene synthase family protein [Salinarimonas sp.]|nr:squalene/phytoene synthase family protein [Salinarimonas sp.]